jgi:hypothetical protein
MHVCSACTHNQSPSPPRLASVVDQLQHAMSDTATHKPTLCSAKEQLLDAAYQPTRLPPGLDCQAALDNPDKELWLLQLPLDVSSMHPKVVRAVAGKYGPPALVEQTTAPTAASFPSLLAGSSTPPSPPRGRWSTTARNPSRRGVRWMVRCFLTCWDGTNEVPR